MSKNLVIVESPAKCRTIQKYLGRDWRVEASFGHIRDLPPKDMGVDLASFKPRYQVNEGSAKSIRKLKEAVSHADLVWLASDPDREGEAIAWHLQQALKLKRYHRISFNEITQRAVQEAVKRPRKIDMAKVDSQQGRRILDRLIGWVVSPALSNLTGLKMAAGRVQSPAVRLIKEREDLIKAFDKTDHFGVELGFNTAGLEWVAQWETKPFIRSDDFPYITDRGLADAVAETRSVTVISNSKKKRKKAAPAPFITISLQQSASNALKFSPKKTMQVAQRLYEVGLITYMRTDNPNLSDDGFQLLRDFMTGAGQRDLMEAQKNTWKSKGEAQEAHEAIRCTDFALREPKGLKSEELLLYRMIRSRAIASQMKAAIYEDQLIVLEGHAKIIGENKKPVFNAKRSEVVFKGWLVASKAYENGPSSPAKNSAGLPSIQPPEKLQVESAQVNPLTTKPPRRYTEASLAKELEKRGIGRPSTFANIIETIQRHEFVELDKRFFHMRPKGIALIEVMRETLKLGFIDYQYTRNVEVELDKVAQDKLAYTSLMRTFYQALQEELGQKVLEEKALGGKALTQASAAVNSLYLCPQCDKPLRQLKAKKHTGVFWGCSGYAQGCKSTFPDDQGVPYFSPVEAAHFCSETQSPLVRRKSKRGWFWVNAEGSKYYDDLRGKPVERSGTTAAKRVIKTKSRAKGTRGSTSDEEPRGSLEASSSPCPSCGQPLLLRKGRSNKTKKAYEFWGCSAYPSCTTTLAKVT